MRVLWIDADGNPFTEASGWRVLEDFGLQTTQISSVAEAIPALVAKEFDLLLVRAEMPGAQDFLVKARTALQGDPRKIVVASSEWSKEEFKKHSKTAGAAHRYARVPMPPEGFLGLVADLFGCAVSDLVDVGAEAPVPTADSAPARATKKRGPAVPDSEDVQVLRKYLRIKEEQLEISEGEREELALENERLQKEAQELQSRLRELEHLQDETGKKLAQMEEERSTLAEEKQRQAEERDRTERALQERLKALESQLGEAGEKYENLRTRVRKDIRKIRENERDLEARLELLRRDSETLLQARDERVLDMQRKIDALEFDLDQVQDGRVQAEMESERYLAKLSRVARALHIAVGMIEDQPVSEDELDELEPVSGGAAGAEEVAQAAGSADDDDEGGGAGEGGEGGGTDELPPADATHEELPEELRALANDGEPTQMINAEALKDMESSG